MAKVSDYVLWKLAIRGISRDDVELLVADPDADFPSRFSPRHCYVREVDGRRIHVLVEPFDHEEVVTAYVPDPE